MTCQPNWVVPVFGIFPFPAYERFGERLYEVARRYPVEIATLLRPILDCLADLELRAFRSSGRGFIASESLSPGCAGALGIPCHRATLELVVLREQVLVLGRMRFEWSWMIACTSTCWRISSS